MLGARSPFSLRFAAFVAVIAALLAAEVSKPALSANAPPKHIPTVTKQNGTKTNWFGINWSKLVPKSIPKIHLPAMRAHKNATIPKMAAKQAGVLPAQQPRGKQAANAPNAIPQQRVAAQKPQPIMKPALHELTEAWRYIDASPLLSTRSKNALSSHIGQALTGLGSGMPKASASAKKGNHLKLAEEHLVKANKEVLTLSHLSPEVQKAVLKEIKSARD